MKPHFTGIIGGLFLVVGTVLWIVYLFHYRAKSESGTAANTEFLRGSVMIAIYSDGSQRITYQPSGYKFDIDVTQMAPDAFREIRRRFDDP